MTLWIWLTPAVPVAVPAERFAYDRVRTRVSGVVQSIVAAGSAVNGARKGCTILEDIGVVALSTHKIFNTGPGCATGPAGKGNRTIFIDCKFPVRDRHVAALAVDEKQIILDFRKIQRVAALRRLRN